MAKVLHSLLALSRFAALLVAWYLLTAPTVAQDDRPNILWLTAEDMSPVLGCWGDEYAHTPNLDAFAKESVTYTRAFATAPVCSPARSCLITGMYATSLGTQHLRSEFPIPAELTGFPTYLRQLGYYTSNDVKTDYNTANEPAIIAAAWNTCNAQAHWRDRQAGQPFFSVFNDMTTHQSRTMVWTFDHFRRDVQSQLPVEHIHAPEFAPVPAYYPNTPQVRETIARFYDCVSVMDQNAGRRLQELKAAGLEDDTIVFFFSDHGSGLPRHKRLLLDSGLHVPLMIRFPEKYQHLAPAHPGEKVDRLVSFVDFAPTLLSLLDIEPPDHMQGNAFLGRFAGPEREYVFGARDRVDEAYDLARAVRDKRYLYIRNYMPHLSYNQPSAYSDLGEIRGEITRLARADRLTQPQLHYAGPRRAVEELYDTQADPQNLHNLATSTEHRTVLQRLRQAQADWCHATIDLGYLPEVNAWRVSPDGPPFSAARSPGVYDLDRIRQAADLVGVAGARKRQLKLLQDSDPVVRYWAAVGLHAGGEGWNVLADALDDDSPPVRIEAASACLQQGERPDALERLVQDLQADDPNVQLLAARALELSGERARAALPQIKAAQQQAANNPSTINLFLNFSTTKTLVKLGELEAAAVFTSFR